ncbi:MAG: hypothetical protein R3Y43_05050 [Alphaproteobacteria bacterium]
MKKILLICAFCTFSTLAKADCNLGDFLFLDGSCSNDLQTNKNPVGIVVDAERNIALSIEQSEQQWTINGPHLEISSNKGLAQTPQDALEEFDGQELAPYFDAIAPNFYKAMNYCASMDYVNARSWFLPELGLLNLIYQQKENINNKLSKLEKPQLLQNSWYWSGSQYSYTQSWLESFFDGSIAYQNNDTNQLTRCVINF